MAISSDHRPVLRLGHSPDPDDAFMWWPLFESSGRPPRIDTCRFRFQPVTADIESLNQRSLTGELDITAISCAQYPFVADKYVLTACGASMGDQYGPKVVSCKPMTPAELCSSDVIIAIPGLRTSAFGALSVMLGLGSFRHQVVPFEHIIDRIMDGSFAAGLVIHEGQLTFAQHGLHLVEDLGRWWSSRFGLPLPLGINVIKRDLENQHGKGTLDEVSAVLAQSVSYALAHRAEGIECARAFGRGISASLTDEFVAMYVNRWTLDFGPVGRRAVHGFLDELHRARLTPALPHVPFLEAAGRTGR